MERTQLVKITVREFLDDITFKIQTQCILLLGVQVLTIFLCIKRVRLNCNFIVYDVQNATYSIRGAPCPALDVFPLLNTRVKVHISVWIIREYPKRHSSYLSDLWDTFLPLIEMCLERTLSKANTDSSFTWINKGAGCYLGLFKAGP